MQITLRDLLRTTGGELEGSPDFVVEGAAGLAEAGPTDAAFLENPKYAAQVPSCKAGAIFLPADVRGKIAGGPGNKVYSKDPRWAFAQLLGLIEEELNKRPLPVISAKADVHYQAQLGRNVAIGHFTVVDKAIVGEETVIGPQCFIGHGVRIGKGCRIYPQVVIREHCVIGDRVIIHSGSVIGADGYGFATDPATGKHRKVPQIGNVVVEDDVEIGANVAIDRATTGSTRIGAGTKIDNLVQIGHNVTMGRNCLVVSQVGVAGSTKIGNQVVLAGQAGIVGHLTIGDGAIITAQTGVMGDVEPKAILFGSPARPHREAMKLQALMNRLPEMYETLKQLKELKERFAPAAPAAARQEGSHAR